MGHHLFKLVSGLALSAATLGYAGLASAQENAVIIIDASGSMSSPGAPDGTSKWEIALQQARDFVNLPHSDREYELWTFSNSTWTPHYRFADGAGKSVAMRQSEVLAEIDLLTLTPYTTPLAKTVCDAIDALIAHESGVFPPPSKRIRLLTDGLENNSAPHPCAGNDSVADYNPAAGSRGGLDVNSWEWKVINKAITGSPSSTATPPVPLQVVVDIAALFDYIPTSSLGVFSVAQYEQLAPNHSEIGPFGATFSAPLSVHAVSFFQGLASVTGGDYVQIDPATPPPTPGDVDGSGCTDYADYVQVLQFYGQQVTVPHSDRADLTRDGWVDYSDYLVVVQNWGMGPSCGP